LYRAFNTKNSEIFAKQISEFSFTIKAEQVLRLNENKDFNCAEAQKDFGFIPLSFEEGIRLELKSIQAQAA